MRKRGGEAALEGRASGGEEEAGGGLARRRGGGHGGRQRRVGYLNFVLLIIEK